MSHLVSFYFFYWLYFLDPIRIYQIYKKEETDQVRNVTIFFQLELLMELACFES